MDADEFLEYQHTSWNTFDDAVVELLRAIAPRSVIDIGAGSGKYAGLMARADLPESPHLTAIEPGVSAAERLRSLGLYNSVVQAPAESLFDDPFCGADLVIMGDVIEHMRASDGLDLLQFLVYRAAYILVLTPDAMPMFAGPGFFGCHNSIWRPQQFEWHDLWAFDQWNELHLYLLRGYQAGSGPILPQVVERVNATGCPLDTTGLRPQSVNLRIHDTVWKQHYPDGSFDCYRRY